MYLLKHMHEMDEIPEKFSDTLFRRLFILSEIGNFTAEELEKYEASMRDMSDYYNIIDTAAEEAEKRGLAKGMEIGREEGRLEGRQEVRIETARKFKELGVDLQTIALATGLDVDIIEKL